jgi:hypothetical protein
VRLDGSAHWWYVRYLGEEVLSSFESDDGQMSSSSAKVPVLASRLRIGGGGAPFTLTLGEGGCALDRTGG